MVAGSSNGAFLWKRGRGLVALGTLPGGTFSAAAAVNDLNHVVGYSDGENFAQHAFIWTRKDGMRDLGTLKKGIYSEALAVNDRGAVVGDSSSPTGFDRAFQWTERDGIKDLGALRSGKISRATGINCFGQIVGYSTIDKTGQTYHAFFLRLGEKMRDLGTLPGDDNSFALAVNFFGQVAGESVLAGANNDHAVLWTKDEIRDLGLLPSGTISVATAVSDFDEVVGYGDYGDVSGSTHAFLWSYFRGIQDLNDLIPVDSGWTLLQANGVNVFGEIVGVGTINNQEHAFLLSPCGFHRKRDFPENDSN
jgi:probable HAF family extracellular repeat protein